MRVAELTEPGWLGHQRRGHEWSIHHFFSQAANGSDVDLERAFRLEILEEEDPFEVMRSVTGVSPHSNPADSWPPRLLPRTELAA